jgi:hypothetical protein
LKPKWSTSDKATLRAAYINSTGAVVAAVIGAVIAASVVVYLAVGSSSASQSSANGTPTATRSANTAPTHTVSSATVAPAVGPTWTETAFSQSKTFADYVNAGYPLGAPLSPGQPVKVSCRVRGFVVQDGDPWWYRLASPPWNGHYYATSDVFYNTPNTSGNPINGVVVDKRVPVCSLQGADAGSK